MLILFGDVGVRVRPKPTGQRILSRHLWIERVGVTRSDYGVKNIPDRVAISFCCLTNIQHERKDLTSEDRLREYRRTAANEPDRPAKLRLPNQTSPENQRPPDLFLIAIGGASYSLIRSSNREQDCCA